MELLYEVLFNCTTISLPNFSCGDAPRGIVQVLFFRVFFFFWEIISTERGISGVIEKPIRD